MIACIGYTLGLVLIIEAPTQVDELCELHEPTHLLEVNVSRLWQLIRVMPNVCQEPPAAIAT